MTTPMPSRERVNRALTRRDHDRVPRHDGIWPETIRRWQGEGLDGGEPEAMARLGSDLQGLCWSWPVPFPGRHEVLHEDEHTVVARGNMGKVERTWKDRSGTPEHIEFDCDSRAKWDEVYKPALLGADVQLNPRDVARDDREGRRRGLWTHLSGIESFEAIRQLVGDAVVLMAMAEDPDWVRDMSTTYTDLIIRDFEAVLHAGVQPDGMWLFGDLGYNSGPFFSPSMYRDLIWPDHKRLGDWAHARGMKFIYHTDGDVRSLVPSLVEAGANCLQPLEAKAKMDLRELVPLYGATLSFFGNIDMTVAMTNDRERVEAEVVAKLTAGMSARGYMYHSDHSVPPGVSWSTYQFIIELLDRHGSYE